MVTSVQPVILCGGSGTRLWPLSSTTRPKQFVTIADKGTLLDLTIQRLQLVAQKCQNLDIHCYPPILIMHKSHKGSHDYPDVIYEDYINDTGVAVARACCAIKSDDIMLVLPADHYIESTNNFVNDIVEGIVSVTVDNIVLYGISPTSPETKYGYIIPNHDKISFKEKPTIDVAIDLINKGALWNSGIFASLANTVYSSLGNLVDWIRNPREEKAPSFDVAVLQEHPNIYAHYCSNWKWSDVGTWEAFMKIPEIQEEIEKQDMVKTKNCDNVEVLNYNNSNIKIIGCTNILVVTHGNDILIIPNTGDHNNELKELVTAA